jgi:ABC-type lipoprotein release transport system permease subunit
LNRSYARQLFGDESPIGHRVGYEPAPNNDKFLVVGEVADAHVDGPRSEPPPVVYMNIDQNPSPIHAIQVRTAGDPMQIAGRIRGAIHQIDQDLPVTEFVPLTAEMNDSLGTEKLLARLAAIYAGLTLLLVGIGFYGVMSYRTTRRKTEFGIRLALGATRQHLRILVAEQTARILLAGVAPGLLISVLAIHMARHLLFGSMSTNSLAVAGATVMLIIVGLLATIIPSHRAVLADPLETLRSE